MFLRHLIKLASSPNFTHYASPGPALGSYAQVLEFVCLLCFAPDQWLFTSCLRKSPLLRPFVSLGLNNWCSESCVITEHSDFAHLAAFPSVLLPPHLSLSFLPTFLSHTGNSASRPLMWSNSVVCSSYLHTQNLMLLLFVFWRQRLCSSWKRNRKL